MSMFICLKTRFLSNYSLLFNFNHFKLSLLIQNLQLLFNYSFLIFSSSISVTTHRRPHGMTPGRNHCPSLLLKLKLNNLSSSNNHHNNKQSLRHNNTVLQQLSNNNLRHKLSLSPQLAHNNNNLRPPLKLLLHSLVSWNLFLSMNFAYWNPTQKGSKGCIFL